MITPVLGCSCKIKIKDSKFAGASNSEPINSKIPPESSHFAFSTSIIRKYQAEGVIAARLTGGRKVRTLQGSVLPNGKEG